MLRKPYTPPPRCLLLDLDGTLVDSVPDLAAALNRMMQARGLPVFAAAEIVPMVGDGAAVLTRRAFAARGLAASQDDIDVLVTDYTSHAAEHSRLFPGVADTLAAMRLGGWRLAVCTNKPAAAAHVVLAALGIDGMLEAVGGGDSFSVRKPDPGHLLATLAAAGGTVARALMLGDHHNDVAAATGAGVACIFAGWGYGPPAMAEGAAAVAAAMADVPAIAERLIAP